MKTTNPSTNTNLDPGEVVETFGDAVERTRLRLREGLHPSDLLGEIRAELKRLASGAGMPDAAFALRACALLGTAVGDDIGTTDDDSEVDDYIDEHVEDLLGTVSSLVSLLNEFGRDNVAASMRRLFTGVADLSVEDLADGDYFGDLFLATADAIALVVSS
jgi:hypothetical protein